MNDARGGDKLLPSLLLLLQVGMDLPQECMDLPRKRTFLAREQATFGGFQHFKRLFHPARGDESSGLQAQKPGDGLFLVSTWNRREESFGNIQGETWFIVCQCQFTPGPDHPTFRRTARGLVAGNDRFERGLCSR